MYKLRLTFMKTKSSIYIPTIDIPNVFNRAFVRLDIDLTNTKTNKSYPEIVCAATLPIGMESSEEICDVITKEKLDTTYLVRQINNTMPDGIIVLSATYVKLDSNIKEKVYAAVYEMEIVYNLKELENKSNKEVEDIKNYYKETLEEYLADTVLLIRKNLSSKQELINIKPYILDYFFMIDNRIRVTVCAGKRQTINPEYIIMGYMEYIGRKIEYNIRRIKILYEEGEKI